VGGVGSHPASIVTLGAAFSANKGAASMLQALLDNLPGIIGECRFEVLTTYPNEDLVEAPRGVEVVSCTPLGLALLHFPLALAAAMGARLGLPREWFCRTAALEAIRGADVVLDVAGISFVDGRGIATLGYNVLMTSTPILLGKPVVKMAQALGPFESPLNRFCASTILPRLEAICARGRSTETHLRMLDLDNVHSTADLAFSMQLSEAAIQRAERRLGKATGVRVAVIPSAVVQAYARSEGIAFETELIRFIDVLCDERGFEVVLIPHAIRPDAKASRMNDLPLCRSIHSALKSQARCRLVEESLPAEDLRALIELCHVVVTARFHAMVSALATTTPVLVIGWSHKYAEVLEPFGLEEQTMDYADLSADGLLRAFDATLLNAPRIRSAIAAALPAVRSKSEENYQAVAGVLRETG
jgi:polysaccharide pyruvyl transferase WcaK-like protein